MQTPATLRCQAPRRGGRASGRRPTRTSKPDRTRARGWRSTGSPRGRHAAPGLRSASLEPTIARAATRWPPPALSYVLTTEAGVDVVDALAVTGVAGLLAARPSHHLVRAAVADRVRVQRLG